MASATDEAGIQFRILNSSKGPAVRATRAQADRVLYRKAIRTSMGAAVTMPFARLEPWPRALDGLRATGFTVAALTPRQPSLALDDFKPPAGSRVALLVGTEGDGLTVLQLGVLATLTHGATIVGALFVAPR